MFARIMIQALTSSLLLLGGSALAQQPKSGTPASQPAGHKKIEHADTIRKSGDVKKALDEYEKVQREPVSPAVRHESAMKAGESRIVLAKTEKNKQQLLNDAAKDFQHVIAEGNPEQKARAHNNLATVYLSMGQPQQAIDSLKAVQWTQIDKSQHYALHYNLARAYDKTGDQGKAVAEYHNALKNNPQFTRAADQAIAMIGRSNSPDVLQEAYALGLTLIEQGQADQAKKLGLEVLQHKPFGKKAELGFAILLRAYAKLDRQPQRFLAEERQNLDRLERAGYVGPVDEIRRAYLQFLEVDIPGLEIREVKPFPWFSSPQQDQRVRQAFAIQLNQVGNYYATDAREGKWRDPRQSLARYLLSWMIDGNTDAAQNAARILAAAHQQLDPENKIYDRLVDVIFHDKVNLYAQTQKTKEDWENILRMHLLLGMIFESQGKWGSETEPRSAIFQWSWALKAEQQIRALVAGRGFRAAGLHERLATAYERTKQFGKAFDLYLEAGEKYLQQEDTVKTREALVQAEKLGFQPNPAQKARLADLRRKLNQ